MKECYFCKGKIEKRNITVDYRWDKNLYIIKDVPALVCENCGEKYFDSEVSREMEQVVINEKNKINTIRVPVCKFK